METLWQHGFENFDIKILPVPMDGHCLFHALTMAFFIPYQTQLLNNEHVTREQIITSLRHDLSVKLGQYVNGKNGPRYYDLLANGNTATFALSVPEFSLEYMQSQLHSNNFIGYGYIEYIANQLNKDIYILDGNTKDIYKSDEIVIKNRNSIVLYYQNNHYELGSVGDITHFSPNHPFIQFLRERYTR
jgi:hypothetical protein